MELKFKEINFECFSHATEDKDKVVQTIKNIIPENLLSIIEITENKLEGHFHNPIIKINVKLKGNDAVLEVFNKIMKFLNQEDKKVIKNSLNSLIDETGSFYIRLNKQKSYNNELSLKSETGDIIRLQIKILKKGPNQINNIIKNYETLIS